MSLFVVQGSSGLFVDWYLYCYPTTLGTLLARTVGQTFHGSTYTSCSAICGDGVFMYQTGHEV